ncbi:MgtC/SapB family protein [Marinobacter nanhaiticus D15-8W]|uniref:Protein MgtC n=1 Tax=Marinobacter nanhaiticus D15-8W TaxID=626887 RepID=N6WZA3_9GAMM|nr:MgtC/SapB family protein [Marinobacter nanhaiticus]ENO16487.1 MgtC/SapB family protein [Marinobacter nanhaiticus D15-8W]BES72276.1 MgtC/SapB family protein [Marinobacter nanhaiticus D15-8W]
MSGDQLEIALRLLVALAAGAIVGYERSFHGRPAGFRTHTLVCLASSLLMLVTVYESYWVPDSMDGVRLDPTRMAQGIMTGIGFLGAGVIVKEGLTVRGLTTAASIWITSSIGILAGIGFYYPLVLSLVMAVMVLALFRWVESRMPTQVFYHFDVQFAYGADMNETLVRELIERHGFSIANFSYRVYAEKQVRRHKMVLCSIDETSAARLAETLEITQPIIEFRIAPISA